MAKSMTLNICHLYPDLMDTYGDRGNILSIIYRCKQRGIGVKVNQISINQPLASNTYDLFFFGGGQDKAQEIVGEDLLSKSKALKESIDSGAVLLSICGGYQLLQKYFKTTDGKTIKGIGLFAAYTQGSNARMMNNLLIELNPKIQKEIGNAYCPSLRGENRRSNLRSRLLHSFPSLAMTNQLVGFENHSGKTYLEEGTMPLGTVIKGSGNNGEDKLEGAVYKNAFGCYLHGSLLPKNPHFADYLISKALEKNYGGLKLKPLDDSIEWRAHKSTIKRIS